MRLRSLLAAAIIAAGAVCAYGTANAALNDCPTEEMCLWGNNDFKWRIAHRVAGSGEVRNLAGEANNEMDSWANRSALYVSCGWGGANATGDEQRWSRNSSDNNVAPFNSDEISSWRTRYGC